MGIWFWLELGKIMKDGKWSEIASVRFPLSVSGLEWLVNMLSIRFFFAIFLSEYMSKTAKIATHVEIVGKARASQKIS